MTGMPSNGEKRQRFSMRKLSVGLVSATIGSFFLFAPLQGTVHADQLQNIHYKYIAEHELTVEEQELIVRELPKLAEVDDDSYYLVYRPKQRQSFLPQTGSQQWLEGVLSLGGVVLLVLVVKKGKDGRKKAMTLLVLTSLGSQLIMPSAFALTNVVLAAYNQELSVTVGQQLPKPIDIEGYEYIGYLKDYRSMLTSPIHSNQARMTSDDTLEKTNQNVALESVTQDRANQPVLEFPVVSPEPPVVTPEQPVVTPEQPVVIPENPVVTPENPVITPEPPVVTPENPVITPEPPVVTPENPVVIPEQPVAPEQPVITPDQPVVTPELPVVTPENPVVTPDQPVVTPENPVVTPDQPVVTPDQPVVTPEPPVVTPEQPVVAPVTTEDLVQVFPVAYETQLVEDANLEVGKRELVQEGQAGVRTVITRQSLQEGQVINSQVVSDQVTTAAIPEIIKVGTKAVSQVPETAPVHDLEEYQVTFEEKTKVLAVPYETEKVEDSNLLKGQEVVAQAGQNGERTVVERDHIIDGSVAKTETISDFISKLAVPEIIKIGTRIETKVPDVAPIHEVPHLSVTTQDITVTSVIPYEKKREGSEELPVGEVKLVQAGQDGERTIITRQYLVDGEVAYSELISDQLTIAAQPEIVLVGTKIVDDLTFEEETVVTEMPFDVTRVDDPSLLLGQEEIAQAGQSGEQTKVIRRYFKNGQFEREEITSDQVTREPIAQVVKVGTKVETQVPDTAPVHEISDAQVVTSDETTVETLPFTTERVENDTILKGQEVVSQTGQAGSRTVITRTHTVEGQVIRTEVISDVTVAPVSEIIQVGTKVETQVPDMAPVHEISDAQVVTSDETTVETLPFTTERVENDTILKGQEVVSQTGQAGSRTVITRTHTVEDQVIRTEVISDVTVTPVPEVIQVGTKVETQVPDTAPVHEISEAQVVTSDETSVETLPFTTERVENATILKGQEVVSQTGRAGSRTVITRTHTVEGQVIRTEVISDVTVAPVPEVIQVGTKVETQVPDTAPVHDISDAQVVTSDDTTVETLPFVTERVENNTILKGQEVVSQTGQAGSRTVITRTHTVEGQVLRTEVISDVTVSPVSEIIQVGTKVETQVPGTAPVHEISDAQVVTSDDTTVETLPFRTERVENNTILKGQEVVSQTGQAGSRTVITRTHTVEGQVLRTEVISDVTVAPVSEIIQVGTKVETQVPDTAPVHEISDAQIVTSDGTTVETLPFTTKRVDNPSLAKGVEREVQAGQNGTRTLITRTHTVEGQVLRTEIVSDTTVAPLDQIIEVGQLEEKEKPVVTISGLVKDEDKKAITVRYALTDPTSAYVSALAQVFKGNDLVKEVAITDPNGSLRIDGLDYYTDYTLKTKLHYALNDGAHDSTETSVKDFILEYKKIEFKDIDSVELYGKDGDSYRRYLSLDAAPTNLDDYYVKITSSKFKEMLLPVSRITADGDQFKVTVAFDQLVQDNQQSTYDQNYSFAIAKAAEPALGVYTSFAKLVDAIQANPAGSFVLGADMTADELILADSARSYISSDFTGTLTGNHNGKQYAIYNLKKPLFGTLTGAQVTGLDLKEVAITSNEDAGALASQSNGRTTVTDVSVQGQLTGKKNLGGLIGSADMTRIENSSFTGGLTPTGNTFNTGGIVGNISGRSFSHVKQSQADVAIVLDARNNNQKVGALAGLVNNGAWITDSYATGSITNTGNSGQVGGMVGSTWNAGVINNLVSDVTVIGGHASTGDQYNGVDARNVCIAGTASASRGDEKFAKRITSAEGQQAKGALGITTSLDDTGQLLLDNQHRTDYLSLPNAESNRQLVYQNMEKLLPFYNKETLVYYGNKVDLTSKLARTALVDVVPMVNNQVILAPAYNKSAINKLMLHYADGTVVYQDISYKEDFKNNQVAEYGLAGTDLLYTPEQFLGDYSAVTSQVLPVLKAVNFDSAEVRATLGIASDASFDDLYLDRGFEETKQKLADELLKVLSSDKAINTLGTAVADQMTQKIKDNAAAFMLGLSYLNRWYNINYGEINAKDLNSYKFDFFGNQAASTLDTIINLGKSGFDNLKPANNLATYTASLAQSTGKTSLHDHLETERQLFLPDKTNNEWLKENTKAYLVEQESGIAEVAARQKAAGRNDKETLGVYDRLTQSDWEYRNMLLPLLSLPEKGVFVISTMSTFSFGSYDRYKDKDSSGKVRLGDELNSYVEAKVDQAAIWQRDHFDFWYHILTPETREKLFRKVLNYDGFYIKDDNGANYWAQLNDKQSHAIHDFFGPVGKHYNGNGSGAYATGSLTHFVSDRILDQYGSSVFTHEMTHNFDGTIYFEGKGRREGQGAENYALGMLQSADSLDSKLLVLNTLYTGAKESDSRFQVYNPSERFKSAQDLQDYVKGSMDLLYLMDYLEGDAVVKQSDEVKKKWFRKIENYYIQDTKTNEDTHAGNTVRQLTDDEVAKLQTFNDLIDGDIMNRREYWDSNRLGRNGYYTVSMFSPVYAALSNPHGSPGDFMFRRMAYELLADKGYHQGFLPYVSGLYTAEALAAGEKTYSSWHGRDVGRVTDDRVLKNVYGDQYASWADFKKAKFQESVDKAKVFLRPITIRYEERQPNSSKTVTISSFEDLKRLMDGAVALDVANVDRATTYNPASWVNLLKTRIYNAYLRDTDDFRSSIYEK